MIMETPIVEPIPEIEQDAREVLLDDREWVQAEFAAIMNASGFGDRLIVGAITCPPLRDRVRWTRNAKPRVTEVSGFLTTRSGSRVRSPPGQ